MTTLNDIAEGLVKVHTGISIDSRLTWKDYYFAENALRKRVEFLDVECKKEGIECKHTEMRPKNKPMQYIQNGD